MVTPPFPPPVLIDECLPDSLGDVFRARGYKIITVGKTLPAKSPDAAVAAAALAQGAIVITHDSDFRRLRERTSSVHGVGGKIQRADRIYFKRCSHAEATQRLETLIDIIETEYKLSKSMGKKFMIQITAESYTVYR